MLLAAAVVAASACHLSVGAEADFHAGLDLLSRYDTGIRTGDTMDMWLDVMWAMALLGLGQTDTVVERLTSAAVLADRHDAAPAVDVALRLLAIALAEAGALAQAAILAGYADANFSSARVDLPGYRWIHPRLDHALNPLTDRRHHEATGATWQRGQIMALLADRPAPQR